MYMTITTYKTSHRKSKTDVKVATSQKSHYKTSNNCYYASTILTTTIFKMNSLSQIKKKIRFFLKIFFPCNFVKKYPKDLGWCAIRSRHIGPTMVLSLSWFWARNAKNLTFWGNSSERSRSMEGLLWPVPIAHQPRSFGYFLTKLHGKKI